MRFVHMTIKQPDIQIQLIFLSTFACTAAAYITSPVMNVIRSIRSPVHPLNMPTTSPSASAPSVETLQQVPKIGDPDMPGSP